MKKYCELLAPVGGKEHLRAAVENGADAVYLGGKLFNARINASNFDDGELEEGVKYAHLRNVRVYVTMNTLIEEKELPQALEYAAFLYRIGADALIIQDLGLASLLRKALPDMPLHLSTQGGVCNREGVAAAAKMGFERVVLARELSLEEIGQCAAAQNPEIEVFVHGAMCFCYSGQCQMSRLRGGRSGNRGMCAQPCRLPYTNGKTEGYYLSPKDICLIDRLGELAEAGVASLKIEGRMKSPEYVAVVTSVYRKYLDLLYRDGAYEVSAEDRHRLNMIFNRGGFTEGYLHGNPGRSFMSGDTPKHKGVYIGKVIAPAGNRLVEVRLKDKTALSLGDGVELRGKKFTTGNVVTYIKEKGGGLVIGDFKERFEVGADIYKVTDKALLRSARAGFEKNGRRIGVDMLFSAYEGAPPIIEIKEIGSRARPLTIEGERPAEAARSKPLTEETVGRQLRKTGDCPFEVERLTVLLGEGVSMPLSYINALRRQALEALAESKINAGRRSIPHINAKEICGQIKGKRTESGASPSAHLFFGSVEQALAFDVPPSLEDCEIKRIVPLIPYMKHEFDGEESVCILPALSPIGRGEEDAFVRDNFDRIAKRCRENGIYIGNIAWIESFVKAGVSVYGGYGLNIMNSAAYEAVIKLGVCAADYSLELCDGRDMGAAPVMITEHPLLEDDEFAVACRRGAESSGAAKSRISDSEYEEGKGGRTIEFHPLDPRPMGNGFRPAAHEHQISAHGSRPAAYLAYERGDKTVIALAAPPNLAALRERHDKDESGASIIAFF